MFLSLSPALFKGYSRQSGRNVKLAAHLHVMSWLILHLTLLPVSDLLYGLMFRHRDISPSISLFIYLLGFRQSALKKEVINF
jgi:hypothetical protein